MEEGAGGMTMMRSVLSVAPGGPGSLVMGEAPVPQPTGAEVRIRVRAVGINYPDLLIIEDKYQYKPQRPFAPGAEVSGVVDALGPDARGLGVGDKVMAMAGWGGLAEYVCVPAGKCSPFPQEMPFDEAAAFLMTYGTSYHALRDRAGLKPGETLLVMGAAGGVGLAAVELGKALGARVVAAASSEAKLAVARAAGADETVLYPAQAPDRDGQRALAAAFKAACGADGASVIYDPVGGSYAEPALRAIAWEGRYLVVGFPAGIPSIPLNLPLLKSCDIRGVFWGAAIERDPEGHQKAVRELVELYRAGRIKPLIHARFGFGEASEAIAMLATRGVAGKVVVTMD
jgi:NADPH2:quinone reductase